MPKDEKIRKRVVVEEVVDEKAADVAPEIKESNVIEEKVSVETSTPVASNDVNTEVATEPKETVAEPPQESTTIAEPVAEVPESPQIVADPDTKEESVLPPTVPSISEELHNEPQPMPIPELRSSNGTNPLFIIIPGIFLLGALLGGIYFYQKGVGPTATPKATPTPVSNDVVVTPGPSASPSANLDLSKYPVNIMNGSGIVGEAGKVKTILTTANFTVSGTGNASSYDFTKTVIKAKANVPAEFISQLSAALSKSYVLDSTQTLATSSADSVQIIVGSSKVK